MEYDFKKARTIYWNQMTDAHIGDQPIGTMGTSAPPDKEEQWSRRKQN